MKNYVKYIVYFLFCLGSSWQLTAQPRYYSADSIPDEYWSKLPDSLRDAFLIPSNTYSEQNYLWSFALGNILKDNLNGYDSIQVISPSGAFVNRNDSVLSVWQPQYPFDISDIQNQMSTLNSDSLRFMTYSYQLIHTDSSSKILTTLPEKFSIKRGKNITRITGQSRMITYRYSLFGKLKEIHFNQTGYPKHCPNKPFEDDCHGSSEGEPRKIVFHYRKGRLEYFTQYIYYGWDGQYYDFSLKYY